MYKVTRYVYNYSKNLDDANTNSNSNIYDDEFITYYDTMQSARDFCADISDKRTWCEYNGKMCSISVHTYTIKCIQKKVNTSNNKCNYNDCTKYPTFNFVAEKKPLYCVTHKKEGMVDVKNKKCIYPKCIKLPSYNLPIETTPIYCYEHKKEYMVSVKNLPKSKIDTLRRVYEEIIKSSK